MHAEDLEKHPRLNGIKRCSLVFILFLVFIPGCCSKATHEERLAISPKDLSAQIVLPLLANEYLFKALIHTLDIEAETSSS